ncbi:MULTISPECIES: type II secretion system minor pseudopilin GspI [unclassified Methylibium]|jgi:general secretion pathway protein I|uniref:type II secretion system minor pseudopilin GspI n=1 Tax=unclassified Methylibium TaxID=2633235 RepID=UPI0006F989E5|nr:type II secretion system protein GspI [Methylibium sp. Root1272]
MRRAESRARRPQGRDARGMTLIEVLVALAIVAVTLGAGLKAAGALTDNAQRLTDVTVAEWCADNQLTAFKLMKQFPGVGDSEFYCEQLGVVYQGKMVIRPTPNPNFRRADAVVFTPGGQTILTLSTVLSRY